MNDFKQALDECARLVAEIPFKWAFCALLAAWALLFHFLGNNTFGYENTASLFSWLFHVYRTSPDDDYCLFIPLIVIILLGFKRRELASVTKQLWWPATALLLLGCLLHFIGYFVQQNRVSLVGFLVGLYGITGMIWGKRWLSGTFFPMFLLLFMVPLGTVQDELTQPLRLLVTKISVTTGDLLLGLGYESRGAMIFTASGAPVFDVAPACSGIRSLISLFALSTIYAFLRFDSAWKRLVLIAAAMPLAVVGNSLRIIIVLIVGEAVSIDAGAMIEQNLGFLTFLVAFICLFALGRILKEKPVFTPQTSNFGMGA